MLCCGVEVIIITTFPGQPSSISHSNILRPRHPYLSSPLSLSGVIASSRHPIRLSAAVRPSRADGKLCASSAEISRQCQRIHFCPSVGICSTGRLIVIASWPEESRARTSRARQIGRTEPQQDRMHHSSQPQPHPHAASDDER